MEYIYNRFFQKDTQDYFRIEKSILRCIGLSINSNENIFYKFYCFFYMGCGLYVYFGLEILQVYIHKDDFNAVITILIYIATHASGVIKTFVLYYNRAKIEEMVNSLERGFLVANETRGGKFERDALRRCHYYCTIQAVAYWTSISGIILFGLIASIVNKLTNKDPTKWEMPLGILTLLDITQNHYYYIQYIYQCICVISFGFVILTIDLVLCGILTHIWTQILILQNAIRRSIINAHHLMFDKVYNPSENKFAIYDASNIEWQYLRQVVKDNTNYYVEILKIADTFEDLFNLIALMILFVTAAALCLLLLYASSNTLFSVRGFQMVSFSTGTAFQCFLYCFWGNKITSASEEILFAAYDTYDANIDIRYQRSLISMMQRAQKKIVISAGKFVELSYPTFFMIMKCSFSYYMVLRMVVSSGTE